MTTIEISPEIEHLIPPLSNEERAGLEESLLRDGCREPLSLWHEVLLDGHNRYEICQRNGIPFQTAQIGGLETLEDALLWVVRNQLGRRNLTPYMRAELALMGKEALMREAFENQSAWWAKEGKIPDAPVSPNLAEPLAIDSREEIAKLAGVSHGTISKVERIQQDAASAVVEAVRKGAVSIDAAAQVAALPVEEQEAIAAEGPAGIKKAAAEQRAKRKPAQIAANDDSLAEQLDALRDMLGEVSSEAKAHQAEADALRTKVDALQKIVETDDAKAAAAAEILAMRTDYEAIIAQKDAEIQGLRDSLAGIMNEKNEAIRMVKRLQRQQGRAA